jgi:hypothetical protein
LPAHTAGATKRLLGVGMFGVAAVARGSQTVKLAPLIVAQLTPLVERRQFLPLGATVLVIDDSPQRGAGPRGPLLAKRRQQIAGASQRRIVGKMGLVGDAQVGTGRQVAATASNLQKTSPRS